MCECVLLWKNISISILQKFFICLVDPSVVRSVGRSENMFYMEFYSVASEWIHFSLSGSIIGSSYNWLFFWSCESVYLRTIGKGWVQSWTSVTVHGIYQKFYNMMMIWMLSVWYGLETDSSGLAGCWNNEMNMKKLWYDCWMWTDGYMDRWLLVCFGQDNNIMGNHHDCGWWWWW